MEVVNDTTAEPSPTTITSTTDTTTTIIEGSITMLVPNTTTASSDNKSIRKDNNSNASSSLPSSQTKTKKPKLATTNNNNESTTTTTAASFTPQTVFYNPVQVQNRDLSILIITLFVERRLQQRLVEQKRLELKQQQHQQQQQLSRKEVEQLVAEYQTTIATTLSERLKLPTTTAASTTHDTAPLNPPPPPSPSSSPQQHDNFGVTIMEALAASGLRSLRYWKEIPGIRHILINDWEEEAVQRAKENILRNGLEHVLVPSHNDNSNDENGGATIPAARPTGIQLRCGDATMEMYLSRRDPKTTLAAAAASSSTTSHHPASSFLLKDQFDIIDLDPYGSAAPFLDAGIQAVANGGLLCVTCTDMAALGGSHPETCYGRYHGSMPITRSNYLQEMALRILLYTMATTAARYGRTIQPLLSVGMDFYIRTFCIVHDDKAGVQELSLKIGNVYQSTQCATFTTIPHGRCPRPNVYQGHRIPSTCPETGAPFKVGGPIWLGPLHDPDIVNTALERLEGNSKKKNSMTPSYPNVSLLATRDRLRGLLTSVQDELLDVPLYYILPDLCHTLHCSSLPLVQVKAALVNAGYRVSGYHKEPQAIKTDAPSHVLWDILRVWCKEHPPTQSKKKDKRRHHKGKHVSPGDKDAAATGAADDDAGTATAATTPTSVAEKILSVTPTTMVDFTIPSTLRQKKPGVARFPMNPQPNWGPKPKATGVKLTAPVPTDVAGDGFKKRKTPDDNDR